MCVVWTPNPLLSGHNPISAFEVCSDQSARPLGRPTPTHVEASMTGGPRAFNTSTTVFLLSFPNHKESRFWTLPRHEADSVGGQPGPFFLCAPTRQITWCKSMYRAKSYISMPNARSQQSFALHRTTSCLTRVRTGALRPPIGSAVNKRVHKHSGGDASNWP